MIYTEQQLMEDLKSISIRGRIAYLICLFEQLLLHHNCDKNEWMNILQKLWTYTNARYLDYWLYELAEYMPNSVFEDTIEGAEYITEDEFNNLYDLYNKTSQDILLFLEIIFKCGSCELYTKLYDDSPSTLIKVKEGMDILNRNGIEPVDVRLFKKYSFEECDGWGECFEGKFLSVFL